MTKVVIKSKNYGTETIDIDSYDPMFAPVASPIFKIIEHVFNDWFEYHTQPGAPMAKDIEGMYYGEGDQPAIYSKKGAIRQGIEIMIEEIKEKELKFVTTKDIVTMDIEAAFD